MDVSCGEFVMKELAYLGFSKLFGEASSAFLSQNSKFRHFLYFGMDTYGLKSTG